MILIRHAQTVFNVMYGAHRRDPGVRDPVLTDEGRSQAIAAAEALKQDDIARVVVSPYWRTLQTAEIIADALRIPVEVEPLIRERAAFTCDIGTPRSQLAQSWSAYAFDHLDEVWWADVEEPESDLHERCRTFCRNMSAQEDWPHVAVITHWGVIKALTGLRVQNCETVRVDPTRVTQVPADGG